MRILTSAEMAAVDRAAQRRGIPALLLMESAGAAVVQALVGRYPSARRIAVLCGPGNNGGDGLVAARLLAGAGLSPDVHLLDRPERYRGEARTNFAAIRAAGLSWTVIAPRDPARLARALAEADVIVDALFGTGLSRALRGAAARLVAQVNASGRPVVSVDLPSGLSGDGGSVPGPCVSASLTVALASLKRCHVLDPARQKCGDIAVADIGIPDDLIEVARHRYRYITGDAVARLFPPPRPDAHKGDFGHVLIVGGSLGKAGAAVLAARAALRAGAGLVTVATPDVLEARVTAALPEAMTLPLPAQGGALGPAGAPALAEFAGGCDAAVIGPGLSTAPGTVALLERLIREIRIPAVFDADALNSFAGRPERFRRRTAASLLTPHPGEAGRLLGGTAAAVNADRPAAAARIARASRAICVLKGAGTITASPRGELWHNPTGTPALATAGSGDILSGIAGAFLARGLEPADAAVAAAFVHGLAGERAAERIGPRGVLAREVADEVPGILASFG